MTFLRDDTVTTSSRARWLAMCPAWTVTIALRTKRTQLLSLVPVMIAAARSVLLEMLSMP